MTTLAVPSFASSLAAVARLSMLRTLRSKKLRLALVGVALVVGGTLAARYLGDGAAAEETFEKGLATGFFSFLVFLVPFLFHSGSIAEEVEGRTFPFLAGRPTGRFAITFGKYLASTALTAGLLAAGLAVLWLGCFATTPSALGSTAPLFGRSLLSLLLLSSAYGGICLFWGAAAPDAGGIVAIVHLGAIEYVGSALPLAFRLISLNHHATEVAGLERGGMMATSVPTIPLAASGGLLAVATVAAVGIAAAVVQVSEYRFSKS